MRWWQDALTAAAIRLEIIWNQLAMTHDFSLLCEYAMGTSTRTRMTVCPGIHRYLFVRLGTPSP